MKILIIGTGAVGAYFGGKLALQPDNIVDFTARSNYESIKQNGIICESKIEEGFQINVNVSIEIPYGKKYDLILITVKSFDTDDVVKNIESNTSDNTIILSIQNGLINYDMLCENYPENTIRGYCRIAVEMQANKVIHTAMGEIIYGEENGFISKRAELLSEVLTKADVKHTLSGKIKYDAWLKFAWNCTFNLFTAASMLSVQDILNTGDSLQIAGELFDEVSLIAASQNIHFNQQVKENILSLEKNKGIFNTSTLLDRKNGKPMEYESFSGYLIQKAAENNLNLPHIKMLHSILKAASGTP